MENSSRALQIAVGILIAVFAIGLIVGVYTVVSDLFRTKDDVKMVEQVEEFNSQYESYNRKLLRGVDVISVYNKAIDNNKKYSASLIPSQYEQQYKIEIICKLIEPIEQLMQINIDTYNEKINKDIDENNEDNFTDFKRRVFDCVGTSYNTFGRINNITFKERTVDN